MEINPLADVDLYFCRGQGFDVEEVPGRLNGKKDVSARLIPSEDGFYSKLGFDSLKMQRANRMIIVSLKH